MQQNLWTYYLSEIRRLLLWTKSAFNRNSVEWWNFFSFFFFVVVLFVQTGISQCLWTVRLQVQKVKHGECLGKADYTKCQSWRLLYLPSTSSSHLSLENLRDDSVGHAMFFSVIRVGIMERSTACWFQGNLAILLSVSKVCMTLLSLVLCQGSSLLWRWRSACSRKPPFFS